MSPLSLKSFLWLPNTPVYSWRLTRPYHLDAVMGINFTPTREPPPTVILGVSRPGYPPTHPPLNPHINAYPWGAAVSRGPVSHPPLPLPSQSSGTRLCLSCSFFGNHVFMAQSPRRLTVRMRMRVSLDGPERGAGWKLHNRAVKTFQKAALLPRPQGPPCLGHCCSWGHPAPQGLALHSLAKT